MQRHSFGFIAFYCCSWLILPALCHLEEGNRAGWHVAVLCQTAWWQGTCLGCHWVCTTSKSTGNGGETGLSTLLGQSPALALHSPSACSVSPPPPCHLSPAWWFIKL